MTEPHDLRGGPEQSAEIDPDADPRNMNPRDTLDEEEFQGDPDADPRNMNPRET
jgi:hypothetical protein